jgi:hypothetical protein
VAAQLWVAERLGIAARPREGMRRRSGTVYQREQGRTQLFHEEFRLLQAAKCPSLGSLLQCQLRATYISTLD